MKRRRGFAVVELPAVILILGLVLLGLTLAIYLGAGKFAWFLLLPGIVLVVAALIVLKLLLVPNKK